MSFFIFVTGGVMSSIGKGIASASIGSLLQAGGYTVRLKKLDPYINIDPGTMSPYKHGEVFVMGDGCEADLDFGHYERFTDLSCSADDSITTGKVYDIVLKKERKGDYLGSDIQVIPHITNEIKDFIKKGSEEVDFTICEIGGTIGDIEGLPYIEALRQLILEFSKSKIISVHLTYLPFIKTSAELKTKPTQHSVKQLQSLGVQPDIILCRTEKNLTDEIKSKLSLFCNVKKENVIEGMDKESIYLVPNAYHKEGIDKQIYKHFGIFDPRKEVSSEIHVQEKWGSLEKFILNPSKKVKIAVVGKYSKLKDAYLSLSQAIIHSGFENDAEVNVDWIDSDDSYDSIEERLKNVSGIIIPGGFSSRGTENKIKTIQYARENNIPFLGICLGMQLSVIEACRNILKMNATSREFSNEGDIVVDFMSEWELHDESLSVSRKMNGEKGGTMRLGNYLCSISKDSLAYKIYSKETITERHRHRFEVNLSKYKKEFENAGIIFSGMSVDGKLPEIMERKDHRFFVAVQFHPEFKSRPFFAHPLFKAFIKESLSYSEN